MEHAPLVTRAAGLAALHAFTPRMGRAYAAGRNTDAPGATSALSPYIRRRLILEQEAVDAALAAHGEGAEKFVQEVFWRTYFKGYLEARPGLWSDTQRLAAEGRAMLDANPGLRRIHAQAVSGTTGIDGFDDWAQALVAENWLHNHTRMWFASIWIFTLRLPWALGAAFFMQHLADGDPASNTLSWRWVAGLHTRGKPYAARAENIMRYTEGRYRPTGLNEAPVALEEADPPAAAKLPPAEAAPAGDVALMLHLDDLHPESLDLGASRVVQVGGVLAHADDAAPAVQQMDETAMADALARAGAHFDCPAAMAVPGWNAGLPVIAAWAPVGPSADALEPCIRLRRAWDSLAWPHATRGFFQVKAQIPRILGTIAAAGAPPPRRG